MVYNQPYGVVSFEVLYKNLNFNELIMKKQYNFVDMLSFIGGLLGLLAGFSFLTFVEVIYWFSFRMFGSCFRKRFFKVSPIRIEVDEEKKQSKFWTTLNNIGSYAKRYLESSTIHSFNYIAKSNGADRSFWFTVFFISMIACGFMIAQVDKKIPNSRVMSLDDSYKHFRDVSFQVF